MKERDPWFLRKGETKRQWKSQKRQELKKLKNALSDFRLGCWCEQITRLSDSMSCKNWGR